MYADGKLVGFAGILTFVHPHYGAQIASLDSLFVSAPYRTAGLGTALLRTVEQFARDAAAAAACSTTAPGGQPARDAARGQTLLAGSLDVLPCRVEAA